MFKCNTCNKEYAHPSGLARHKRSHTQTKDNTCLVCQKSFTRRAALNHHMRLHAARSSIPRYTASNPGTLFSYNLKQSSLRNNVVVYNVRPQNDYTDANIFQRDVLPYIKHVIMTELNDKKLVKYHVRLNCSFKQITTPDAIIKHTFVSFARVGKLLNSSELEQDLISTLQLLAKRIEDFQTMGSGWVLDCVGCPCELYIAKYTPIAGGNYIPLPVWLQRRNCLLNIKTRNQNCFVYSILAALFPSTRRHQHRPQLYAQHIGRVLTSMINQPTSIDEVPLFEVRNNLSINIFGIDENDIVPLYSSKIEGTVIVNLLLLHDNDNYHYVLIKDLNKLLRKQKNARFICTKCLSTFKFVTSRDRHKQNCVSKCQRQILPKENKSIVKFEDIQKMHRCFMVFYLDTETLLLPVHGPRQSGDNSYTMKVSKHEPMMCLAKGVAQCCGFNTRQYINLKVERGVKCVHKIIENIINIVQHYMSETPRAPITMSSEDWTHYRSLRTCQICGVDLFLSDAIKIRDHCHHCGRYRWALCESCNFEFYDKRVVNVVTHNFSSFDSTFVAPALADIANARNYKLTATSKEGDRFLHISMKIPFQSKNGKVRHFQLRFIDSLNFLTASLANLSDSLAKRGRHNFHTVINEFGDKAELLMKKQIMPYSYFTSESKLDDTNLPDIAWFRNDLTDSACSREDYLHAQNVWKVFGCTNLYDYYTIYLKVDVALLVDVFENFREFSLEIYRLDPVNFLTLPSMAYSAMLFMTKARLELITNQEMYDFVSSGIRGGVSVVSTRLSYANDGPTFDASQPRNTLYFVDAVNLYGFAMSQSLATGGYMWLTNEEIATFDYNCIEFDGNTGYFVECDLRYPEHLHKIHDTNPLAPEQITITTSMLSEYQKGIAEQIGHTPCMKLVAHLGVRRNYVLDGRNLKLYTELGMEITKIHRILKFDQSKWMQKYIEFNTNMRANVVSDFEKMLFKLMNNAVFGKNLENPLKYRKTFICTTEGQLRKRINKPTYASSVIYTENLIVVNELPSKVFLNKMRIVGAQVTELAKHLMYSYYYKCLVQLFGQNVTMCLHDTDSYLVSIVNEPHVFEKLCSMSYWHDFSTLSPTHPCYSAQNKGVPGKLAPELNGRRIVAFVGIRSKMYAIKLENDEEKKRAKGVTKHVRENTLTFDDYVQCVCENTNRRDRLAQLRRLQGEMFTVEINKKSLVNFDDKRFLINSLISKSHGNCENNVEFCVT